MLKSRRLRSPAKKKSEYDIYLYMNDASEENKTQIEKNLCNLIKKNQMFSFSEMPRVVKQRDKQFCEFSHNLKPPHPSKTCILMCINKKRDEIITENDIGAFMIFYFKDKVYEQKKMRTPIFSTLDIISAVKENDFDKVKDLIKNGCNLDVKDEDYNTALQWAIKLNNVRIANYLIANGADLDTENAFGHTALHLAAQDEKNYDILVTLLQYNANINGGRRATASILEMAINANNQKAFDLLLMIGNTKNTNYGEYEKEMAEEMNYNSLIVENWDSKKYRLSNFEKESIYVDYLCSNQINKVHKGSGLILLNIIKKCADKMHKKDKTFFVHLKAMPEVVDYYFKNNFEFFGNVDYLGVDMVYNKSKMKFNPDDDNNNSRRKSKKFRELSKLR